MASSHFIDFEMLDFSGEKSSFRVNTGAITALSLPGFLTEFGNLRNALDAITKGTIARESWTGDKTLLSNIPPIDSTAQRELAWLVAYEDNFGALARRVAVPTPDLSLLIAGTDDPDFTNSSIAAFITAFEAIAVDPTTGNPVTVFDMQLIGRKR